MKISLVQAEIEAALVAYVAEQGISLEGKSISVDMTAGRGASGFSAEIDIQKSEVKVSSSVAEVTQRPTAVTDMPVKAEAEDSVEKEEEEAVLEEEEDTPKNKSLFG